MVSLAKWCTWQTALQIWPILWNNEIDEGSHFLLTSNSETMTLSQILEKMCIEEIVFPQRISTPDLAWYSDLTLIFAKFMLTARCKGEMVSILTPFYICLIFSSHCQTNEESIWGTTIPFSQTVPSVKLPIQRKSTVEKSSTQMRSPFDGWQNLFPFRGEMV